MSHTSKSLLIISYYSNMPGACQAEWIDDKIFAFVNKGYNISLITASCCYKHDTSIEHIRVPALSPHGAKYEFDEIKRRKIQIKKSILYGYVKLMAFVGNFFNKLGLNTGEGRWSWFISSAISSFFLKSLKNKEFIFTTGGPASAHLTGILLGKLYRKKIVCELQDPLSGEGIGRNKLSSKGLELVERQIVKYADCIIYATQNAMLSARTRYGDYSHKIYCVYPGAKRSMQTDKTFKSKGIEITKQKKINITYLGSLYQTRNLDSLMCAIDELYSEDSSIISQLEINLFGNMNEDIRHRIENYNHKIIFMHGLIDRDKALQKASDADVLLFNTEYG